MLRIALFIFLLFSRFSIDAQPDLMQEVKGLPTKQIFDLMTDSRGFIWIGHELGLSRFDGTTFTHFSCPQQNSLAVGDIVEDNEGRIWCRNFSSQIFYVEDEKMKLLASYDYKNEPRFPRITIIGNKLVACSIKGLFVYNTTTTESFYIPCGGEAITTISILNNKIIAFGILKWFIYDPNKDEPAKHLQFGYSTAQTLEIILQPHSYKDTIYSFSPRTGDITKLLLKQNKVIIAGKVKSFGFMNTINPCGNNTWIHTNEQSKTIDGTMKISGYNLSDLVIDKQGNTWYSSFKYGLLVKYKSFWEKIRVEGIEEKDIIVQMETVKDINIFGTSTGKIIIQNTKTQKITQIFRTPPEAGPILYLKAFDESSFIVSTALRIYMLKNDLQKLQDISSNSNFISLKNATLVDTSIFMSSATGLYELLRDSLIKSGNPYKFKLITGIRSRWVEYDKGTNTLLVAFKDGLAKVKEGRVVPLMYKNETIPAVTLQECRGKFYISTFSKEIFKFDSSGLKKINILNEHTSSPVYKIKILQDTVWLLGADFIVLFNATTEKVYRDVIIPSFPNANVYDIVWIDGQTVLLTSNGVYALRSSRPDAGYKIKNFLLKISVNERDTFSAHKLVLPHNKNSIVFFLSAPFYTDPEKIYFKYRLAGSADESWRISSNGQNEFRFSSLSPGKYLFEAIAVHPQFGMAEKPIVFSFKILPVWYQTVLFKIAMFIFFASLIILYISLLFKARLKKQKISYERQLAVHNERNRISAEIHDDIGAGLSGVLLLTELTGNKVSNADTKADIGKIYTSITELSSKMQEVIWSLNTKNDTMKNLLQYIEKQAVELFGNSPIKLIVSRPDTVPLIEIVSDKRTDIYLTVKEALHNVLKHSGAGRIDLNYIIENDILFIEISDNGKGMQLTGNQGNGMLNMKKRINRLGGTMVIREQDGVKVEFSIPLK